MSRPEIFCWVLVGRRSRSLMLFVGQTRVSEQNRSTVSRSRQNSSRSRPGSCLVELRGPGTHVTSDRPTRMAWRKLSISGSPMSDAMSGRSVSRAWFQAWISPPSARPACSGHTAAGWASAASVKSRNR